MKFPRLTDHVRLTTLRAVRPRQVLLAVAVLLGVLVIAGTTYALAQGPAGRAADDYRSDVKQWREQASGPLTDRQQAIKPSLFEFKNFGSPTELSALRNQCSDLSASAERLAALDEVKPPQLKSVRLGWLSSKYRTARDEAASYAKKVSLFQRESDAAVAQFARDCRYLEKISSADVRVKSSADRVDTQGLRSGEQYVSGGRVYGCPKSATCAPARDDFARFAVALRGSLKAKQARAGVNDLAECARSVLGKKLCVLAREKWQAPLDAEQDYVDAVIKAGGRPSQSQQKQVASLYRTMNRTYDQAGKSFGEAAIERWPGLGEAPRYPPADISEYYTVYLVANERLAILRDLAAGVVDPAA